MKLPNGALAIVDIQKLRAYCRTPDDPGGRNKARVFASFGIRQADAGDLRTALLRAAENAEARSGVVNSYGQRYIVDFEMVHEGRTMMVRSTWIVLTGE